MLVLLFLTTSWSFSPPALAERFDTSGMPRRAATFAEQQILEMIATHQPGDLTGAARIQRKLGRYYADKGDEKRATAAFMAAAEAEKTPGEVAPAPEPPPERTAEPAAPPPRAESRFAGNFFGFDGRTLHTWEFKPEGSFLHTWVVSGAGTSVRNSERGAFRAAGGSIELTIASAASGFVTPGVGGRETLAGGGRDERPEVRRLKFATVEGGIVLDGVKLKIKSW